MTAAPAPRPMIPASRAARPSHGSGPTASFAHQMCGKKKAMPQTKPRAPPRRAVALRLNGSTKSATPTRAAGHQDRLENPSSVTSPPVAAHATDGSSRGRAPRRRPASIATDSASAYSTDAIATPIPSFRPTCPSMFGGAPRKNG